MALLAPRKHPPQYLTDLDCSLPSLSPEFSFFMLLLFLNDKKKANIDINGSHKIQEGLLVDFNGLIILSRER